MNGELQRSDAAPVPERAQHGRGRGPRLERAEVHAAAQAAGLALAGITTAQILERERAYLLDHVRRGMLSGFDWYTEERAHEVTDPRTLLPDVRSIISVGVPYWSGAVVPPDDGVLRGRIARYAWGNDYHRILRRRMRALTERLQAQAGPALQVRTVVDTARILDRATAARAGVGWTGKNSMLLAPRHGSWLMLGEVLLNADLPPDLPLTNDCGRCTRCLTACPTQAIVEPYRVDANRCLSYLTIEHQGSIPRQFRAPLGDRVFGCDICQEVCPYTAAARESRDADFAPRTLMNAFPALIDLLQMREEQFRAWYSGTPVTRTKRAGLARNAALALGNSGDARAIDPLRRALFTHDEAVVRSHAGWALARLVGWDARVTLQRAAASEPNAEAQRELRAELELLDTPQATAAPFAQVGG